jgi:protein-L-isoaspartate O-methyltransferase
MKRYAIQVTLRDGHVWYVTDARSDAVVVHASRREADAHAADLWDSLAEKLRLVAVVNYEQSGPTLARSSGAAADYSEDREDGQFG